MNEDLSNTQHIHCVGIGGIGISALAQFFHHEGKTVTGNDLGEYRMVRELREKGVDIQIGDTMEVVDTSADLIVYSVAWDRLAPELMQEVRASGVPVKTYAEALGGISREKYTIAVAGTHGKTTTTAMIATMLSEAGYDPTVIVGSLMKMGDAYTNFRAGSREYFVVEADEYKGSFLNLTPDIAVITNIEHDHPDYYADLAQMQESFQRFVENVSADGVIVCNPDTAAVSPVLDAANASVRNYTDISLAHEVPIPGEHNRLNAKAAIAAGESVGMDPEKASQTLRAFKGTWRRFEYLGQSETGYAVYDDYAHHPTEIRATLAAFRERFPNAVLHGVFQPHTYSRSAALRDAFAQSFADADRVYIVPTYAAREHVEDGISHTELADGISAHHQNVMSAGSFDDIVQELEAQADTDDVVVVMGAGNIRELGERLVTKASTIA